MCVNSAEAGRLLGTEGRPPVENAAALAERAVAADAVRLVTGRGASPTAVAYRVGGEVRCHQAPREPIPPERIKTLFRAGDVFAANFLARAVSGDADVPGALDAATAATTAFITGAPHG